MTAIGRKKGIPLTLDNTASPILAPTFDRDTAIVVHLLPKYIGRHGTSLGGVTINGGNFDWQEFPKRRPTLNTLDNSYHWAIWAEAATPLGPIAYILKARVTLLGYLGSAPSSQNAFQIIQELETLALRLRQHSKNAARVADYLAKRPALILVNYPRLQQGVAARRVQDYLQGGYGELVGFELAGGRKAGRAFIDVLAFFYYVANTGDARSLAIYPASTAHSQHSAEEQG